MISVLRIFFRAKETNPWLVLFCLGMAGLFESVGLARFQTRDKPVDDTEAGRNIELSDRQRREAIIAHDECTRRTALSLRYGSKNSVIVRAYGHGAIGAHDVVRRFIARGARDREESSCGR